MKRSFLRWPVCLGVLIFTLTTQAFPLRGFILDRFTELPISDAKVELWADGSLEESAITPFDGYFRLELSRGRTYIVKFSRDGSVSRKVVIDTHGIARDQVDSIGMELKMHLFPPVDGMDSILVNAAIGEARWDSIANNLVWDKSLSDPLITRWDALLAAHLDKHPELHPTSTQRAEAWLFEQGTRWARAFGLLLIIVVYKILSWLLRRRKQSLRSWVVGIALTCSLTLALFWDAGGPLQAVRVYSILLALILTIWLIWDFFYPAPDPGLLPPTIEEGNTYAEQESRGNDVLSGKEIVNTVRTADKSKRRDRIYGWLFFGGILAIMSEMDGLYNTLEVGKGLLIVALISVVSVSLFLHLTTSSFRRMSFLYRLGSSICWAFIVFTLGASLASVVNRHFSQGQENCHVWPVDDVKKGYAIVRIGDDTKRLDLPIEVSRSLTSLDSLHCCYRTGVLGYKHIFSIEPVITTEDHD